MDASSLFIDTFRAWRRDLLAYLGWYLVAGTIVTSINVAVSWVLLDVIWPTTDVVSAFLASARPNFLATYALWVVIGDVLGAMATTLFTGTVTYYAISRRRGTRVSWSIALKAGLKRFPSVLVGALFLGAVVAAVAGFYSVVAVIGLLGPPTSILLASELGLLLILLFVVFVEVSLFLYAPAVMIEGLSGSKSLRRSWHLTQGHRGPIFGAFLLVGLILVAATLPLSLLSDSTGSAMVSVMGQVTATTITGSWLVLLASVVYERIGEEQRG